MPYGIASKQGANEKFGMHDYILSLTPHSFSRVITRIVVLILRASATCKKVIKKNLAMFIKLNRQK